MPITITKMLVARPSPKCGEIFKQVLNEFLQNDYLKFQQTIREWPPALYDIPKVLSLSFYSC